MFGAVAASGISAAASRPRAQARLRATTIIGQERLVRGAGVARGGVLAHVEVAEDVAVRELEQRRLLPDDLAGRPAHDQLEVGERPAARSEASAESSEAGRPAV